MIQELPIHENTGAYYSEPLLEYVIKIANHFWECYDSKRLWMIDSVVPEDFCKRYHEGKIKTGFLQKYLEAAEIMDTLRAYNLDTDKFWYLCLLVKDYSEGQTQKASLSNPTHKEEINRLIAELGKLTHNQKGLRERLIRFEPVGSALQPTAQEHIIKTETIGKLTLRIGEGKTIVITDEQTLVILREALTWGFKSFHNNSFTSVS